MESGAKREGKRAKQWGSESPSLPFQSAFICFMFDNICTICFYMFICLITFVHEPVVVLLKNMGGGGWGGGLKAPLFDRAGSEKLRERFKVTQQINSTDTY